MPNLMQRGAAVHARLAKVAAGRTVTYRRGTNVSTPIIGWQDKHDYTELDNEGIATTVEIDDWTFTATDLIVGGEPIEPRRGDLIEETLNGVALEYQVLPLQNAPPFKKLDTSGIVLLVHTKLVKRAE
jgi:hypothetical protein